MKFLPFSQANEQPEVIVVDAYLPGRLNLSHWRGVELSSNLLGDTSTEIVLNALARLDKFSPSCSCTNNHFDIDGFLGVWALHNPDLALTNVELLTLMARIGDFRELSFDSPMHQQALSYVCHINQLEAGLFYPPFEMDIEEADACIPKYEYFLEEFTKMLLTGEVVSSQEYELVCEQVKDLNSKGKTTYFDDIRLMVVETPYQMHYYPLFQKSNNVDTVLTIYPGQLYELEQKYTTWVQTTRPSYPRVLLSELAEVLNAREMAANKWVGDHFTDTGPILRIGNEKLSKAERFDHPMNREIMNSSIPRELLIDKVVNFFRKKYQDVSPKMNWTWEEMRLFNK